MPGIDEVQTISKIVISYNRPDNQLTNLCSFLWNETLEWLIGYIEVISLLPCLPTVPVSYFFLSHL